MKKTLLLIAILLSTSCARTDLAKTLRYADERRVLVKDISFQDLQSMKQGKSCTYNFLYVIPMFGDGSIITAANKGKIDRVKLIGQSGFWTFPFNQNCTVVYGD